LELTIAVNHLAHQVLLQRLLSLLLRKQGQSLPVLAWSPGLVIPRSSGGFFRYS
jgi:protochlorophyllide reductase